MSSEVPNETGLRAFLYKQIAEARRANDQARGVGRGGPDGGDASEAAKAGNTMSSNILPMPVAAAIINGVVPIRDMAAGSIPAESSENRRARVRAAVREATFVQAQPASDMLWLAPDNFDHSSDYPPLRTPFPFMWFEWQIPDEIDWNNYRSFFAIVEEHDPA
jgi:hypothetical protein